MRRLRIPPMKVSISSGLMSSIPDLVSGMTSRTYRKNLAAQSVRPQDSMLTLKFRLDHPEGLQDTIPFDRFRDLYGVVEDVKKGSLIHYLFSVILSGFRIFATAGDAETFSSRKSFRDTDFSEAFKTATGLAVFMSLLSRQETIRHILSELILSRHHLTSCHPFRIFLKIFESLKHSKLMGKTLS